MSDTMPSTERYIPEHLWREGMAKPVHDEPCPVCGDPKSWHGKPAKPDKPARHIHERGFELDSFGVNLICKHCRESKSNEAWWQYEQGVRDATATEVVPAKGEAQ